MVCGKCGKVVSDAKHTCKVFSTEDEVVDFVTKAVPPKEIKEAIQKHRKTSTRQVDSLPRKIRKHLTKNLRKP